MITMLLAASVFHQVLVVELPADGKTQLPIAQTQARILDATAAKALADSLEGAGAKLLAAPSLLEVSGEGAKLSIDTETASFSLEVQAWKGSTRIELNVREGKRLIADVSARFAVPDGATWALPIDDRHIVIGRVDDIGDGATLEAPSKAWRASWASLLGG